MEFAFGLDRLLDADNGLKGFYVGKVVDDGAGDPQGRIRVRIESLFGKEADKGRQVPDAKLPWIQMMPSCGLYVRPQKGDFVTVIFQGSIYEGFYIGSTVSGKIKTDLGASFVLNFHNAQIFGDYDGSITMAAFRPNSNKAITSITMDAWTGDLDVMSECALNIQSSGSVSITSDGETSIQASDAVVTADSIVLNSGLLSTETQTVTPNPAVGFGGPFCALPVCLLTGVPHCGNVAAKIIP